MRKISIAAAFVVVPMLSVAAIAADMPEPPTVFIPPPVYPTADEGLGGLYLRGSLALGAFTAANFECVCSETPINEYRAGYGFGVGLGYEFGGGVRVEAALDYMELKGITATNGTYAKMWTTLTMGKIYYDFDVMDSYGEGSSLVPYVGFGLGVAHTRSKFYEVCDCLIAEGDSYSAAASATAGFSYDLGGGVKADLGYELLYINKVEADAVPGGNWITANHVVAHQIKASVRIALN